MVVFQYGSAVLFNVESYFEIVRRHASGLLPEMRKDGMFECFFPNTFLLSKCDGNDFIYKSALLLASYTVNYFTTSLCSILA